MLTGRLIVAASIVMLLVHMPVLLTRIIRRLNLAYLV